MPRPRLERTPWTDGDYPRARVLPSHLIEQGWCQGAHARDGDGHRCSPHTAEAASWSLMGAILWCRYHGHQLPDGLVTKMLLDKRFRRPGREAIKLEAWNDQLTRTQTDVIELLQEFGV